MNLTTPRSRRALFVALVVSLAMAITAGAARADDLLVLQGDSETLSGSLQYGLVYIDGDLRLAGDTSISANSIYIGPDASLISCFAVGTGDNGCTAGRSLSLQADGTLTIATGIDLTAGSGSSRPGGNLSLTGNPVTVAGDVTTAGSGGAQSGQVSISSTGALAVGAIYSPGAAVSLTASSSIVVGGDINTSGDSSVFAADPTRVQSAGPVTINSSGGDVRIDGSVYAQGLDAPSAGTLGGGNAAPVSITGSNVQTGAIYATGGGSAASVPGSSEPITINARGALQALGELDASGQDGASGSATPGMQISLTAAGPLTLGGDLYAGGGQSAEGGTVDLSGSTVTTDQLWATGGDGSNATPSSPGGVGGAIRVTAPDGALLGSLFAYGGSSEGGAAPGSGGSIDVTGASGSIAVGSVQTQGGYTDDGPGASGGPITLEASDDLSVGSTLNASGSDAGGSFSPPPSGGDGGSVALRAGTGTLSLDGNALAEGGSGANPGTSYGLGGSGGSGGQIDVVAQAVGALASLSSRGGDGGDYGAMQGAGGPGGAIYAFTSAPIFNAHQLVDSDGGDGNPTGVGGHQSQDLPPTALVIDPSTGVLGFTSQSPDAQLYRVMMSVAGAPSVTALESASSSGLTTDTPLCEPVTLTVVALNNTVDWTSDPSPPFAYTRQPSTSQRCSDAPRVTGATLTRRSLRQLRRARWFAAVPIESSGIGALQATLTKIARKPGKGKTKARSTSLPLVPTELASPGQHTVRFLLPLTARSPGSYRLQLTTTSPDGKDRVSTGLTLEIVP
ncbi:MAG: beta strand repeat-containing protein [Solirubrobacteraceae bacterium]